MTAGTLMAAAGPPEDKGLPATLGGWALTPIRTGLWVSPMASNDVPAEVLGLAAEPGRHGLVVDATGPDPRTDTLISALFPLLPSAGFPAIRLNSPLDNNGLLHVRNVYLHVLRNRTGRRGVVGRVAI